MENGFVNRLQGGCKLQVANTADPSRQENVLLVRESFVDRDRPGPKGLIRASLSMGSSSSS